MWTHIAVTGREIDYQIYPRLLALAEVGWSPQQGRAWAGFEVRLRSQFPRLHSLGVTYRDPQAVGKRVGVWSEQDLKGKTPRDFDWDVTQLVSGADEVEVQVRWASGTRPVYARSVTLLENGRPTSQAVFPAPLTKRNDVAVGWLSPGARHPGSRYTLRVTLKGTKKGSSAGSVWIMKPAASSGMTGRP